MVKPAPVDHQIHPLLAERWSPRAFSPDPVPRDQLLQLFEAARWAPSSYNEQPWRYIVATKDNSEHFEKVLSCLVEFNQQWARQAPVLAISIASKTFQKNGKPNRHALHDVGAASAMLSIQATALGLFVHQMAGIDIEKIRQEFALNEDEEPVAGLAIGKAGDSETLPEKFREGESKPRTRKPLSEVVWFGV